MPLSAGRTAYINAIKATLDELKTYDGSAGKGQTESIDKLATDLADATIALVQNGDIATTVAAPIPVQVVVATGTGATTAPGSGTGTIT